MTSPLKQFFTEYPKVALAFSGGVDSAYLLYQGLADSADIHPYYVRSCFQPDFELEDAKKLAEKLHIPLTILESNILSDPHIAANPANRCYFCKKKMFELLRNQAFRDGYPIIIDGTNASDSFADRPGMLALRELGVRSPLREAGLTKEQIRTLSRNADLFTWNKPAYACLATRIPPETPITRETLKKIEHAENFLMQLGFFDFRVRVNENSATLKMKDAQMPELLRQKECVRKEFAKYFDHILLDLEGR